MAVRDEIQLAADGEMINKRLRLLLIAPSCNAEGGGEVWVAYQWAKHLSLRHDVTLLTYNLKNDKPASRQLTGLRVIEWSDFSVPYLGERFNAMAKPGYFHFYFRARSWIKKALARGERFDVAHQPVPVAMRYPCPVAGFGIPFVLGPVGGSLSNPPSFAADQGPAPWFTKFRKVDALRLRWDPLLRRTYESADCVIGIAPYVKDLLAGLHLRRFEVMSETGIENMPEPIDRSGRSGPVRLLYVGRLIRTKGARDIITAVSKLGDVPVVLDIVGDGPDRSTCQSLIGKLGLQERVMLHGWVAKSQVGAFYQKADLFVFPSYREPGGNVQYEAMAHSLPLIVADRGGPAASTSESCAIKLPITTPDALVEDLAVSIRKLTLDGALRRKMGEAAYEHVVKTGLWSAKVDKIGSIYDEIMEPSVHGY
jgi:glycosyltransferase involved in cell wall biosynthesis